MTRILIVEDDRNVREVLAQILEHEGYQVRCAVNGAEAIAMLKRRYCPDLILLDLNMPVMNGWAFRAEQQHLDRQAAIPVVLLSTEAGLEAVAASLGITHTVKKPVLIPVLLGVVQEALSRAG